MYYIVFIGICLGTFSSCKQKKSINPRVTLWRNDKIPYGDAFAFDHLKSVFPLSTIVVNSQAPADFAYEQSDAADSKQVSKEALIIIGTDIYTDSADVDALLNYVGKGNQLLIASVRFSDSLLAKLNLKESTRGVNVDDDDGAAFSLLRPGRGDSVSYSYPGIEYDEYFSETDSQYCNILGRDKKGRPNFVSIRYTGGGCIYLLCEPLLFSNFFLLHKNNRTYYENALSYIPVTVGKVRWDDYFRHPHYEQFSAFSFILKNKGLKWAFWLLLVLFGILYLFESKRKQRAIPIIPPLVNSSVEFVKTIGTLYYQQKDNQNLAAKMIARFLEHVRSKYQLSTTVLDELFVTRLAAKSGQSRDALNDLVYSINELQTRKSPTDAEMLALQKRMELFYKQ